MVKLCSVSCVFFALLFSIGVTQAKADCLGVAQVELNVCSYTNLQKSEVMLNQTFHAAIAHHKDDTVLIKKLELAQESWLKWREAEVEAIFPEENKTENYGSVYPQCDADIRQEMNTNRILQLRQWIEGVPEGEVCSGSF